MPAQDLLRVQEVTVELDLAAIRGRPGTRVACAVCAEDIVNRREVFVGQRPYCRACAGEGYYRTIDRSVRQAM